MIDRHHHDRYEHSDIITILMIVGRDRCCKRGFKGVVG